MPIHLSAPIRDLSQDEFGEIAYEVMRHVFAIHNELGRFFDERIYRRELAFRLPGVRLEQPIDVVFDSFHKRYFLDVLVNGGGIFEFKAVAALAGRQRAQLLNYLLLCNVSHGKLINVRTHDVEHEFVNTRWKAVDRTRFVVCLSRWNASAGAQALPDVLIPLLRDWGAGLELSLYEEAVTHFLGGLSQVESEVDVNIDARPIGRQRIRLLAPGIAFRITSLEGSLDAFETHARRLLQHVNLKAIVWVNINIPQVTFITLQA